MMQIKLTYPKDELRLIKNFLKDVKNKIDATDSEECEKLDVLEDDDLAIKLLEQQEKDTYRAIEKLEEFIAMVVLEGGDE